MPPKIKIVGLIGSLRKGSYNRGLMDAARELLPEEAELEIAEIAELPLFNEDLEGNPPEAVREFKAKIKSADALLFATPEYNYSVPGVLKNAIDWASRPYGDNSFEGKPAAIMGASGGMIGTARAQYHLRQIFVFLNIHPLNKPEVMVPLSAEKFDASGKLVDEPTRERVKELLSSLVEWTKKLGK